MLCKIGTSGWQYDDWSGAFYPEGLAKSRWLEHYGARFATVESNSAFYRLPAHHTFAAWRDRTPEDFEVAVKASRYLTHVRRLRDPDAPVRLLMERLAGLGEKCGPVLLQLPPNLPVDTALLDGALRAFPATVRVAVEPRHPSWFCDETRSTLERRGAAWCLTDMAGRRPPLWRTATWGYARFHRGRATPSPCYGRAALAAWVARLGELWPDDGPVYCYFNNDQRACAVRDARVLGLAVRRLGHQATRTPSAREVVIGG